MKAKLLIMLLLTVLAAAFIFTTGCRPVINDLVNDEEEPVEEPVVDVDIDEPEPDEPDPADEEEPAEEKPVLIATYYWPFLSHGQLLLSSGEIINGPSLIESEPGLAAEFTADYAYSGRVVWLVEKTDVFEVQWVNLSFEVHYYDQHELEQELIFVIEIDGLEPEPAEAGLQEFAVDFEEEQEGFLVAVDRIILAKEQDGKLLAGPLNYIAFDLEMKVVEQP